MTKIPRSPTTLATRLAFARKLAGISGRQLASLAGLQDTHAALIETGRRVDIEARTASALARVLGVSIEWLVDGAGDPPERETVVAAVLRAGGTPRDSVESAR